MNMGSVIMNNRNVTCFCEVMKRELELQQVRMQTGITYAELVERVRGRGEQRKKQGREETHKIHIRQKIEK